MSLFFSKLLPIFVYPLGAAIVLVAVALVSSSAGFRRIAKSALVVALAILWLGSMPALANWLYGSLEARYPPSTIATIPRADVAIILGGAVGEPLPPRVTADLGAAGDRLLHAARLLRSGKVDWILISGGNLPWQTAVKSEAEVIAELLAEFGVPRRVIVLETGSRNTYENAIYSAAIVRERGWRSALLVTSGKHMPRAVATFRRAGIEVTPAATDIRVRYPIVESVFDFLPDAGALARTTEAIKEYFGVVVYRWRGWA